MDIFNYEPQSPVILTRPYSKPQPCDKINANVNAELYDAIMKNHLLWWEFNLNIIGLCNDKPQGHDNIIEVHKAIL